MELADGGLQLMPAVPFIGPSYTLRSRNIDAQRTVNLMPMVDETRQGKTVSAFIHTPGLRTFVDLGELPIRGMIVEPTFAQIFVVYGSTLAEIKPDGSKVDIANLLTTEGVVKMASNGRQIVMVDGPNGYVLRLSDYQFSQITSEGWLGSYTVTFLDGYFVFAEPATQKFYISQPYSDPIEIDPLDFASAEGSPDNIITIGTVRKQLWIFGAFSTEIFYNSGAADFPFLPIQGAFIEHGIVAPYSLQVMDDSFFWIGNDRTGSGIVYMSSGMGAARISTDAVEQAIQSYGNISAATGYTYNQEGRRVYVINFPKANTSWGFDVTTGEWHERQYLNPDTGMSERSRPEFHVFADERVGFEGRHLVSDYKDGRLYEMRMDVYTDDGDPIRRLRRSPHMASPDLERITYQEFQIDIQAGVGLLTNPGIDPQLMLRWSNDGGYTWSNEVWSSAGKQGQYSYRAIWRRLGSARDRVWEVQFSDPVPCTWLSARAIIQPSMS